jgi:hypothetical protein
VLVQAGIAPPTDSEADRRLSSALIGIAKHIRSCDAYRNLLGDAHYIEQAASRLSGAEGV